MTRYEKPSGSVVVAPVRSGRRGRVRGRAKKSTTSRAGLEPGCSTLTKWWVSAATATTSLTETQRWRMIVDGC